MAYLGTHAFEVIDGFTPPATPSFTDVPVSDAFYAEVECAVTYGIMSGFEDGAFHPELTVSRAEAAANVARWLAGGDAYVPPGPATPTFPDVPWGHWAYKYIEYAAAQGVFPSEGEFHPEWPMDAHEAAEWLLALTGNYLELPRGTVSGTVTDMDTGSPLGSASVTCGGASGISDADGTYSLLSARIGAQTAVASLARYESADSPVLVLDGAVVSCDLELTYRYGTVEGTVTEAQTGLPLEGAAVTCGDGSGTTAADGSFSFEVAVGSQTLTVRLLGYAAVSAEVEVTRRTTSVRNVELSLRFSDVPLDHWAFLSIIACCDAGIVKGFEDGTYAPSMDVSRDQMAVYIARAHAGGEDNVPPGPAQESFPDVPPDFWAYDYIEYAYEHGIVSGYLEGLYAYYHPSELVDRGQMAVYIARAKGWIHLGDDMTTAPALFPDVPAGFWAGTAVQACIVQHVVQGYDDGYYRPEAVVTRDQMAVYIARAFGLL